jgi:hypothetical protein
MDVLACSECGYRFYVPGVGPSESRCCSQCGGDLVLALDGVTSIPLDARWLDPRVTPADAPKVTVVDLRRKRERAGKAGKRIARELADYFAVRANGRSIEVSLNRGGPADAALRVAAVLDGVDGNWEQHFYLPTAASQDPPPDLERPSPRQPGHLHLVASSGNGVWSEGSA